jgi:hypothetical protein
MQPTILYESLKKMALHLLQQFLYSLSHYSLYTQHNHLRKSQKDGAASALAIPLQPLSPLHECNTIFYESLKRWLALYLLSQFLYSTASFTAPYMQPTILYESLKKMALYLLSQFLYSLSHHSLHANRIIYESLKKMALHLH